MPKKAKQIEPGIPARRNSTATALKKSTKKSPPKEKKLSVTRSPSDDDIRLRAYFISERRHRLALPGDASSDWLEAKRQLLSETGPR